jgi:hypothetical protein
MQSQFGTTADVVLFNEAVAVLLLAVSTIFAATKDNFY